MAEGASLEDATRKVLGLEFSALDLQWRQALKDEAARHDADESKKTPAAP